jgi:hypothetical protein
VISLHVLASVHGCEGGLTRPGVLIAILRRLVGPGLAEVSRTYTCWHTFMGGTLTASFNHEPRRVPGGRWVAQRVRRLASVWLGSNIQSSLEVTRVRSELGCHSHRFSRRPRQSSRALVHCHQTPCCSQLSTL